MDLIVGEYKVKNKEDLKNLFIELQAYEKTIWSDRAESTEEFVAKFIDELLEEVKMKNGKVYLAFENEVPVGFIAGYIERDSENNSDYFRIDSLVVKRDFRNKGVGTRLVEKIGEYAKSTGQSKVGLGVLVGNFSAYDYYKRLGFKDYGIEMIKNL